MLACGLCAASLGCRDMRGSGAHMGRPSHPQRTFLPAALESGPHGRVLVPPCACRPGMLPSCAIFGPANLPSALENPLVAYLWSTCFGRW
eukprot:scaffold3159_cov393-Prasinococcus_capsulatus_cf.AAC.28